MQRELGWGITAAVALAAVIGVSSRQGGKPDSEDRSRSNTASAAVRAEATGSKIPFEKGPCVEIENRLQAFLLGDKSESRAGPLTCYAGETKLSEDELQRGNDLRRAAKNLQFVIATVPDPAYTHFSLSFDRYVEAIQEGISDEHYFYDSSWLPWEAKDTSYALIQDQDEVNDRKERREGQPGILLFRSATLWQGDTPVRPADLVRNGLVVFVVGEEPTHGIHRDQFNNAIAWIRALQDPAAENQTLPIRGILGPTFTGSLPSLASLLRESDPPLSQLASEKKLLPIYSGNVSGKRTVDWFRKVFEDEKNLRFESFQQNDDEVLRRFCWYLDNERFDLHRLAILSEDETAYGEEATIPKVGEQAASALKLENNSDKESACPAEKDSLPTIALRVYYPRGIAALRTAYQKQAILGSSASSPDAQGGQRTLSSDLADSDDLQHDTIREYNTVQTPQAQEAVLQQIVNLLREHHSEYIVLRASNALDRLFLAHYLRVAYPHGRIVTVGADLMLSREAGAARLSGIMTLSTYPLLAWEPHWTRDSGNFSNHSHRVFSEDGVEGLYLATRALVHGPQVSFNWPGTDSGFIPQALTSLQITDYAVPFWAQKPGSGPKEPPPVWLSVLGRNEFWPLAAISDQNIQPLNRTKTCCPGTGLQTNWFANATLSLPNILFVFPAKSAYRPKNESEPLDWGPMPLSLKAALIALLIWTFFHLICCSKPSITSKPNHRAYFVYCESNRADYNWLLLLGSLTLSSSATILAFGSGLASPDGAPLDCARCFAFILFTVWVVTGTAFAINLYWHGRTHVYKQRPLWAYAAGTIVHYYVLYYASERMLNSANRVPTYWRSMELTNGVSPVVPLLALCIGMYIWTWRSLQGLAFLGQDAPSLPREKSLMVPGVQPKDAGWLNMFGEEKAAAPIHALWKPFALWHVFLIVLLLEWVFAAVLGINYQEPIRSLGARSYAIFTCFAISVFIAVTLANAGQLLSIWIQLRRLLVHLDRLPLRRSMKAIPGVSWGSAWKISGNVLDLRYKLLRSQLECLTHLEREINTAEMNQCTSDAGGSRYSMLHGDRTTLGTLESVDQARVDFARWYAEVWDKDQLRDQSKLEMLQKSFAALAGKLMAEVLLPSWRSTREGLTPCLRVTEEANSEKMKDAQESPALAPLICYAEVFVCYVYLGFIQNVLGRMRTLVMGIVSLFIAITISLACYPFDPRTVVNTVMVLLFIALGTAVVFVYAQMHRDAILSALTNTKPGELDAEFWFKLVGFGAGPVLGLLATIFPELTDFIFSWIQPSVTTIK